MEMIVAHGPLSAIITEVVRRKYFKRVDSRLIPLVIVLSLIVGILPDFDFFILAAQSKPAFLHHNLITHTPIFWISIVAISYLILKAVQRYGKKEISKVLDNGGSELITISILIGTLSHILADLVTGHIMLLYPISNYALTLTADIFRVNPTVSYFFHPHMVLELSIISAFTLILLKYTFHIAKRSLNTTILFLSIAISILFVSTSYTYLNTYNPKMPKHINNMINYDMDRDGIIDFKDHDTNDNGLDNIEDANREMVARTARKIAQSGKLATYNKPILEKIGYLSPYGLVSTAYFESGYTLEPVIKRSLEKNEYEKYNLQSYYLTIQKRESIREVELEDIGKNNIGYTLFIIQKGKVVNAGVIISEKELAIVLPEDVRTKVNSLEEVSKYYSNNTTFEVEIEAQQ